MMKRFPRWPFVLAVVLALLGVGGIQALYGKLLRLSEADVLRSMSGTAEQTAINVNVYMASVEEAMQTLLYDARFQESVSRSPEEETLEAQLSEIRQLRELISRVGANRDIAQIRIYMNDQKLLMREGVNFFPMTEALETPEYRTLLQANTGQRWIDEHRVQTKYFDAACVTLGVLYRQDFLESSLNQALVLIDLPAERFHSLLSGLALPDERGFVTITDTGGEVMLGGGDAQTLEGVLERSAQGTERFGFWADARGEEWAWIVQPMAASGWSISLCVPRKSLLSNQQTLGRVLTLLLFGLMLLVVALVAAVSMGLYSAKVNDYIRALQESLKEAGDPREARVPAHRALFNLDRSIGALLETNKHLAEEKLGAQLRERDVTLQALQAQINPHFLYNTLDAINWMAIRAGAPAVADAISNLADYFRLSLSRGRSIITLAEDTEIVRKYLTLYEQRYEYHYQVIWALAEDSLDCLLPKLTLQPLMENALQHGIFKRAEKAGGIVRVQSAVAEGQLILTVTDNGPGLTQAIDWNRGFGLGNVRRRLDLYFNNRYSLAFDNAPGGGARVIVRVDVQRRA